MIIKSVAATDMGRVRRNNEDNFYLCGRIKQDPDKTEDYAENCVQSGRYLFAVCDGMGGTQHGEIAAGIAVRTLQDFADCFDPKFSAYIETANRLICEETKARSARRMGTTLAALSICGETARCYNIGDSRIYLFRSGRLIQISEDHTQVQMMLRHGLISADAAADHPGRHVLTQHLGILPEEMIIEPYAADEIQLKSGDIFLLCSDGLTDMLTDGDIAGILSENGRLKDKALSLIASALDSGGVDNTTVLLVKAVADVDGIAVPGLEEKLRGAMSLENRGGMNNMISEILTRARIELL